jgi:hypothetical protein
MQQQFQWESLPALAGDFVVAPIVHFPLMKQEFFPRLMSLREFAYSY